METMTEAAVELCRLLGVDSGAALGATCAVMGGLLVALIALGFGPLRGWLSPESAVSPTGAHRARPGATAGADLVSAGRWDGAAWDAGLLGTWRLYRQLRRAPGTSGVAAPRAARHGVSSGA